MVGHIVLREEKGPKVALERERIADFPLLCAAVSAPAGLRERRRSRRVDKAAWLLAGEGVRRVLAPPAFPYWPILAEWGLIPVDPEPLVQALAAPLVLSALDRLGCPRERSVVSLRGTRVTRALYQAALELCPAVRMLKIEAFEGGGELARFLREEFGVPLLDGGEGLRPHVTACFSPAVHSDGDGVLDLCGPEPGLMGLSLETGEAIALGEGERLPFLTLLWEEGRLLPGEIRVCASEPPGEGERRRIAGTV